MSTCHLDEIREALTKAGVKHVANMNKTQLLDLIRMMGSVFVQEQNKRPVIKHTFAPRAKEVALEDMIGDDDLIYDLYSRYRRKPESVVEEISQVLQNNTDLNFGDVISIYKIHPELDGIFLWNGERVVPLTEPNDLRQFPVFVKQHNLLPDHWSQIENFPPYVWMPFKYFLPLILQRLSFMQTQANPYDRRTKIDVYESHIRLEGSVAGSHVETVELFRVLIAVKKGKDVKAVLNALENAQLVSTKIFYDYETGKEAGVENDKWQGKTIFMYR